MMMMKIRLSQCFFPLAAIYKSHNPLPRFYYSPPQLPSSSDSESSPDPVYPGLYHHPVSNPSNHIALSFLKTLTLPINPAAIIGWYPSDLYPGFATRSNLFIENPSFIKLLHQAIKHVVENGQEPNIDAMAKWQKEGHVHIPDGRNPPPWSRIPDPQDSLGLVLVNKGHIQPNTYEPMPAHRLVTPDGLFKVSEPIEKRLRDLLLH